ncbi:MAG TPA: UPF0182 family protein [Candidatus Dormibacteraeota bacterium]|nr:UPF0182 family protein [Candidatus Dormibacteraeota bacterium]
MTRRYRPFDPFERGGPFEPGRDIRIPRPPRRFWVAVSLFVLAIFVFILASPIVWFFTELQWYSALGYSSVFTTRVGLQTQLVVGSLVLAFVYLAANVLVALRVRSGPGLRAVGIRRSSIRSGIGIVGLAGAALIALILSGGAGTQWMSLALFEHATPTGVTDPVLGQDISFYLLTLPFLHALANWALGLAFLGVLLVAFMYAWRGNAFALNFSPLAIAHLSVMLGVFALVLAGWTWLGRYDLLYAHNSNTVWGAAYTDVNARLPLYTFQAGAAVVLAGALIVNAWLRRLWLPAAAAGLWIALLVVGQAYPALVQGVSVTPNAQTYELPYIAREIAGTRAGYGLSNVTVNNTLTGDQPLTSADVQSDQVTINNLRLWDYGPLKQTYAQQQALRTYYTFNDIDLDRYTINGQYEQLEISARELDVTSVPGAANNWVNQHLVYTHGYGVAANPVNAVVGQGLPNYVVGNVPPTGPLQITQPAIYFGELRPSTGDYVLAPNNTHEFDYPQGGQDVFTSYTGGGGVPMTAGNRALWAMKLGDFNLLVSGQITDKTQMLYRRNVVDRASEMAPFLTFDGDPYIVVADGRLYWILDAYTTAGTYPYSQTTTFQPNSNNASDINYVRNSVKVVIDAYDGSTSYYIVDNKDPLIKAYAATFPTLFKPIDAMPSSLRAHVRVPIDLFDAQVHIYATYHITDPKVFFSREDVWDIPTAQTSPGALPTPVEPYYVLFRLPGQQSAEFLLIMPFTPHLKNNMVSWMAARSDGSNYGQYVSYVLPKDKAIFGPQQVANLINQDPTISQAFTLFHSTGSQVIQGNLLVVPIGNSFLYFEPIYLSATTSSSLPELKKVILVDQSGSSSQVVYADTLDQAIQQLVGSGTAPPTNNGPPPTVFTPAQVAQIQNLISQANQHYQAAYRALAAGDLTTFASEMKIVGRLLEQLQGLTGGASSPTGASPSPSPKASASP